MIGRHTRSIGRFPGFRAFVYPVEIADTNHFQISPVGTVHSMEYCEAVETLEGLRRLSPDLGTETTASLLAAVGSPQEDLTAVQIAGSNGKGSTASFLERILRERGLDVGLYTSPDLDGFRERVRVNGRKIPREAVAAFVEEARSFVTGQHAPTFFEAVTAMALWHFGREGVDVAVLEVGIGGRYDATSVVDPAAAAVTTVSLEHTDLLGETVEEIARDKAQVAPDGRRFVTGATGRALETIREETGVVTVGLAKSGDGAGSVGVSGVTPGQQRADVRVRETGMVSLTESAVELDGPGWSVETRSSLLGTHQAVNAGIAAALARQVADSTEGEIATGIQNTRWPGRFEIVGENPLVVLDGAHNPQACGTLASLLARYDYGDLHMVFGAMREKDHAAMVDALPATDRTYLTEPAVERAEDAEALAAVFEQRLGAGPDPDQSDSVPRALERALDAAGADDCVLVAGSLYTVSEARAVLDCAGGQLTQKH
jgi:folylpolyglutamate synthase/dihydrofolate synthase